MIDRLFVKSCIIIVLILSASMFIGLTVQAQTQKTQISEPLKVALLPIPDVLPFHLAQAKGYFAAEGISVEGLPVFSSIDRDQLMQAGQLDAMLTELTTTANFNRDRIRVKIVCIARSPLSGYPLFRILASPGSGIKTVSDLAGMSIGISKNTVIEYVTDRLLAAKGLDPKNIVKKSVPVIPERYQLLLQGQIKAATLPEPLASSALASGAAQIIEDSANPRYSISVISFSVAALKHKPEAVRAFVKAWDRAVADINASPGTYRPLMLKKIRVPKNISESVSIPLFPRSKVPDAGQWADVMDWMISKGLLDKPVPYMDSVTTEFLP